MDPVQQAIPPLVAAVEHTLNPSTPQNQRRLAYETCEEFKEKSPLCAQCGVVLAAKDQPHIIRHFGLQLLEHTVKFRWYDIAVEDRVFIKENTMRLMAEGTQDILSEEAHIKDALSRIVVEMMKREWPQNWPQLMTELSAVSQTGPTQTELVLLVLLRVAEDVVTFKNVPAQRGKDISTALTANMEEIFGFFLTQLYTHAELYRNKLKEDEQAAKVHCRVAHAVLSTLSGYVEWVNMSHIMHENGKLLQLLCILLSNDNLQQPAAECLLIITSRKEGRLEDRKQLLILFSEDAMNTILSAAVNASSLSLTEHHYVFLKKLCQVLVALGNQLTSVWTRDSDVSQPAHFLKYLDAILAFAGHPSKFLGSFTSSLLSSFMRHDVISRDPVFQSIIPQIIEKTKVSLTKVGYPSQNNSPSCEYSRLDFDSDEEFTYFFSKLRCEVLQIVRQATKLNPDMSFKAVSDWMQDRLQREAVADEGEFCNLSSAAYLEWEAMSAFVESVINQLKTAGPNPIRTQQGIKLFQDVLNYDTKDPLILSCVLSCVSALFFYINNCPEKLSLVLNKIFSAAQFTLEGQTKATRSRAVKNVRRHACSVLVKICKAHPDLLRPGFNELYSHIKQLGSDPEQLSQMEKTTLDEALILISNRFNDFQKQSEFIGELMQPVKELWLSDVLKEALWNVDKLMAFVGVDQAPVEPSDADTCGRNRSQISYCVMTMLGVVKRTDWPNDPELCKNGGFSVTAPNGTTFQRNPALPHIGMLFDNILALLRTLNLIWRPEALKKRHRDFAKSYDLSESEKWIILGVRPPFADNSDSTDSKNPIERMQLFFTGVFEHACHVLGDIGRSFGHEFYAVPNLAHSVVNSVLFGLNHLPDYRLRQIIRVILKSYIQNCPKELFKEAVIPVLREILPYMHQHLVTKWQDYNADKLADIEDENPEAQEVLDDQLLRLVTRDYMDLLTCATISRPKKRGAAASAADEESNQNMMEDGDHAPSGQQGAPNETKLSELGLLVTEDEELLSNLIQTEFACLSWDDTQASNKCVQLVWPLLKQVVEKRLVGGDDACHLMTAILLGLVRHGRHESLQSVLVTLAANAYGLLRPLHPQVANVMCMSPNCNPANLKAYDDQILATNPAKQPSEKKRKDAFRKLVADIIGKDVGQQFKKNAEIKNLPPLWRRRKKRTERVEESAESLGICALFNSSDN